MIQKVEFSIDCTVTSQSDTATAYDIKACEVAYEPPVGGIKNKQSPNPYDLPFLILDAIHWIEKHRKPLDDTINISLKGTFPKSYLEMLEMAFEHYSAAKKVVAKITSQKLKDYDVQ